jgi:hypothetical protein
MKLFALSEAERSPVENAEERVALKTVLSDLIIMES